MFDYSDDQVLKKHRFFMKKIKNSYLMNIFSPQVLTTSKWCLEDLLLEKMTNNQMEKMADIWMVNKCWHL